MSDIEELEERVKYLEDVITTFVDKVNSSDKKESPVDTTWAWNADEAEQAAKSLANAFDWEDCPKNPADFDTWLELHQWLDNKVPAVIRGE